MWDAVQSHSHCAAQHAGALQGGRNFERHEKRFKTEQASAGASSLAGASRIREHLLHTNPTCGVAKCTADEAVLQPVLDEMRAIDAQNKAAAAAAAVAERRQLDRSTAANASTSSAPAKKQRTLVVCRGAASRLG